MQIVQVLESAINRLVLLVLTRRMMVHLRSSEGCEAWCFWFARPMQQNRRVIKFHPRSLRHPLPWNGQARRPREKRACVVTPACDSRDPHLSAKTGGDWGGKWVELWSASGRTPAGTTHNSVLNAAFKPTFAGQRQDSKMRLIVAPILYLLCLARTARCNVEKTIFVGPARALIPLAQPTLESLELDRLSPYDVWPLRTRLAVKFPTESHPSGHATWLLLDNLEEGQRYEVRICWPATVTTPLLPLHCGHSRN